MVVVILKLCNDIILPVIVRNRLVFPVPFTLGCDNYRISTGAIKILTYIIMLQMSIYKSKPTLQQRIHVYGSCVAVKGKYVKSMLFFSSYWWHMIATVFSAGSKLAS